jgi:hypothetical protein
VVWQVKTIKPEGWENTDCPDDETWAGLLEEWQRKNRGWLKARAERGKDGASTGPCITPPEARYRGAENQLYRVEIHKKGGKDVATFKWSRDNGSVTFPIVGISGDQISLENLGRDDRQSLEPGDVVEVVDDNTLLRGEPGPLVKVIRVDRVEMVVTLELREDADLPDYDDARKLLLRRWDHKGDTSDEPLASRPKQADDLALVLEEDKWLDLEDGVQICFEPVPEESIGEGEDSHQYRSGDYWCIPARTATGDVEWPGPVDNPEASPPHGVEHHCAPLAVISVGADDQVSPRDCRCHFSSLRQCGYGYGFGGMAIGAGML